MKARASSSSNSESSRYQAYCYYTFDHITEQRKTDMWIGRLPPSLIDKVRIRARDLTELSTLQDLFEPLPEFQMDYPEMNDFIYALETFQKTNGFFFRNAPENRQEAIDVLLSRFPPDALQMFRERTSNLYNVNTWQDVLFVFSEIVDDCMGARTEPEEVWRDWLVAISRIREKTRRRMEMDEEYGHSSYHYLLANEFWTMRMGDDEPFELFKRRVQRYERRLGYDFSLVPEQQKIDMWIGLLTRMEAADSRVERATQFWETKQEVQPGMSFLFAQHLEEIPKEQSCFFQNTSGQVSTDLLLARIPPRELKMLRERTFNFSFVNTWQDVLEQFRRVTERDCEGRHDADTEAD
ncbi:uncharacterized protein J3D65DRAFT_670678 [Phyllosticta citribraziliensis]|uniref:Uncharacterized protein n=1 Tax=Phyllosticta citribraziliensis TaxID=989973 RepID=A0ABR1L9W0_9PEZI